jgi:ATP-dependent Clp protease protease subunit
MSDRVLTDDEIQANVAKLKAEAAQANAEAEKSRQEGRVFQLSADFNEIVLAREYESRTNEQASNRYNGVYIFEGHVTDVTARNCIEVLHRWQRTHPGRDIEIQFYSPGGSITAGFNLFDAIRDISRSGSHVTAAAYGMAASMAGILLQAGDTRVMAKESWLMIHEASFSAGGKIGDVEDTVEWVKMVQERILSIFSERSGLTKAFLKKNWQRKNWWISSDYALKLNLIDEVR